MNIETRGLGAGSYPEPPDIPETPRDLFCEECGDDYNVKDIDGRALCMDCRKRYYLKTRQNEIWNFINSSVLFQYEFAVDFWLLETLEKSEQARVVLEALKREVSFPLPENQGYLRYLLLKFANRNDDEFLDYLDKEYAREVVA